MATTTWIVKWGGTLAAVVLFGCGQARRSAPPGTGATATPNAGATGTPAVPATALMTPTPAPVATAVPDTDPDMLPVPGGPFTMGADKGGEEDEHPAHAVTLAPFLLDRTEVTNAAYAECVSAGECRKSDAHIPTEMRAGDDEEFARPRQPVVGVSWGDARAYCAWRGKRLPREAEFEKAARDTDGRRYAWGNEAPTTERTAFGRALGSAPGHGTTDDVASHPGGRGPYGHDDLAGNVWEWMEDEYDPFAYRRSGAAEGKPGSCPEILASQEKLREEGKQGFTGSNPIPRICEHVLRGGAFNFDGPGLRATNRVHHPGHFRLVMTGFRCAKDGAPVR